MTTDGTPTPDQVARVTYALGWTADTIRNGQPSPDLDVPDLDADGWAVVAQLIAIELGHHLAETANAASTAAQRWTQIAMST